MLAKNFTLPDQDGKKHSLKDFKGKWVVLYFYPKDNTPGCTKEACGFRDNIKEFTKRNAVILGISKDSVNSHKKFADKYGLNFPILSDEKKEVIKKYNALGEKKMFGKTYEGVVRKTYLISPEGAIKKEYPKANPLTHPREVIKDIDSLN
jgi:peroxiredoxin Q/BCP